MKRPVDVSRFERAEPRGVAEWITAAVACCFTAPVAEYVEWCAGGATYACCNNAIAKIRNDAQEMVKSTVRAMKCLKPVIKTTACARRAPK